MITGTVHCAGEETCGGIGVGLRRFNIPPNTVWVMYRGRVYDPTNSIKALKKEWVVSIRLHSTRYNTPCYNNNDIICSIKTDKNTVIQYWGGVIAVYIT